MDMGGCHGLTALPPTLGEMWALEKLAMSYCRGLTVLPRSFGQLGSLKKLVMYECSGLTALPTSLGQLGALETLDMRDCTGLTALPASLRNLPLYDIQARPLVVEACAPGRGEHRSRIELCHGSWRAAALWFTGRGEGARDDTRPVTRAAARGATEPGD